MAAQKGKDILIKTEITPGVFITMAGLRTKKLSFNAESVDVTDSESAGRWRELLAGSGVRRASVGGSGIFKDAQSDAELRAAFFNGSALSCQLVIPGFGTIAGPFQITALDYSGSHDAEMTFEAALESAGELTFAAAG